MRIKSQLTLLVFLLPLRREPVRSVRTAQEAARSLACVCVSLSSCSRAEEPSSTDV